MTIDSELFTLSPQEGRKFSLRQRHKAVATQKLSSMLSALSVTSPVTAFRMSSSKKYATDSYSFVLLSSHKFIRPLFKAIAIEAPASKRALIVKLRNAISSLSSASIISTKLEEEALDLIVLGETSGKAHDLFFYNDTGEQDLRNLRFGSVNAHAKDASYIRLKHDMLGEPIGYRNYLKVRAGAHKHWRATSTAGWLVSLASSSKGLTLVAAPFTQASGFQFSTALFMSVLLGSDLADSELLRSEEYYQDIIRTYQQQVNRYTERVSSISAEIDQFGARVKRDFTNW